MTTLSLNTSSDKIIELTNKGEELIFTLDDLLLDYDEKVDLLDLL